MQIHRQEPESVAIRVRGQTQDVSPADLGGNHGHLETTAVGECSWRVSDMSVPEEDPRHVVAFVEADSDDVEIVWIRGARAAPGRFRDLDTALDAIDDVITTGEVRYSNNTLAIIG
jgi:hypothetical protein